MVTVTTLWFVAKQLNVTTNVGQHMYFIISAGEMVDSLQNCICRYIDKEKNEI